MVKAKEFLSCLCEEHNYRFFTGFPCEGLIPIYNAMSSDFMHYIPAVNEQIAVGLANGAFIAGEKSIVLMDARAVMKVDFSFNIDMYIPIVCIVYGTEKDIDYTDAFNVFNFSYYEGSTAFEYLSKSKKIINIVLLEEGAVV